MKRKIYIGCITVVAGLVFLHDQYRNKAENMQNKSGMRFAKNTQKEVLNTTSITKLNAAKLFDDMNSTNAAKIRENLSTAFSFAYENS